MAVLSDKEQQLYDAARAALPRWMFSDDENAQEIIAAFAKVFGMSWAQVDLWCDQMFITKAVGFFLDQHAIDRGTRRRNGESDGALAARLRSYEDHVTRGALLSAANNILAGASVTGSANMVELRIDKAFLGVSGAGADAGRARSYCSRGYRMAADGENAIILILPYGTDAATATAVAEAMRQQKAGGIIVYVERRLNP
jgi:hypothetical protein